MSPRQYAKAVVGAVIAGLSALVPVIDDGLTSGEVLAAVLAALVGLGAVFAVPNQSAPGTPADPDLSEQSGLDAGHTDVVFLLGIAVAVACGVILAVLVLRAVG